MISDQWLHEQYVGFGKRAPQIALEAGMSTSYIFKRLKKLRLTGLYQCGVRVDLSNKVFGQLEVLRPADGYSAPSCLWVCKCSCGRETTVSRSNLQSGGTTKCSGCVTQTFDKNRNFTGFGHVSGTYWNSLIRSAHSRNFVFSITIEYINDLFVKQDMRCALTGVPICFCRFINKKKTIEQTASLDRICNNVGYVPDNVQWVHKAVNLMKLDMLQEDFFKLCLFVVRHNKLDNQTAVTIESNPVQGNYT